MSGDATDRRDAEGRAHVCVSALPATVHLAGGAVAAVDGEELPGDLAGCRRGEELHGARDVIRCACAPGQGRRDQRVPASRR